MNTAKLVNSALTGGGLIYPENLNVIIGNESKGYPKGYVLDANATLSLAGQASQGSGSQTPGSQQSGQQGNSQQNDPLLKNMYTYNTNLKRGFQITHDDQNRYSNNLIIGDIGKGQFNGNSVGYGSILQGNGLISIGNENILTGSYVVTTGSNNHINSFSNFSDPTYTKIDDNNIIVTVDKNSDTYNLIKNSKTLFFNTEVKDDNLLISDKPSGNIIKLDYTVTDINDTQIKLTSTSFKKFINTQTGKLPFFSIYNNGNANLINGSNIVNNGSTSIMSGVDINVENVFNSAAFGCGINITNNNEIGVGTYNVSKALTGGDRYAFTIGAGSQSERKNAIEVRRNGKVYIQDIGGFNGHNSDQANTKTLQKTISDIETALSLNSNGPWDVDITSEFVNGNVTIKQLSMWSISQGVKRVYFTANLKQGDVITIPDTLRMYIGWKISNDRFGMADWNAAGKKYTVTTDSNYVILVATENDNPGVQTNNLPSFGKVMLRTSNPEFKPTAQTDAKKDHTNDDKVMRGIAHQGFHKLERANSLAAFRAAAKEGWRYVETDTYMTKDGKFVVSHDSNIPVGYTNGTTTLTDTSYKYEQHTLAEILAFHGPNGQKVDTLEEFCKLCKECGLHPYIEIKQGNIWEANTIDTTNAKYNGKPYAIKLLDIVNRYGLRGNATFISSTPYTLRLMAQKDYSYRYGIVYFDNLKITDTNLTTLISKIEEFNNDTDASKAYLFVDVNIDNLKTADANIVNLFVSRNCALEVWTAKTKEDLDNLDPYVTGVTSDNIHAGEILAKKI